VAISASFRALLPGLYEDLVFLFAKDVGVGGFLGFRPVVFGIGVSCAIVSAAGNVGDVKIGVDDFEVSIVGDGVIGVDDFEDSMVGSVDEFLLKL